jgi:DNA-binding NtrC family response regulator
MADTRRIVDGDAPLVRLPGARLVVRRGVDKGRALKIQRERVVVGSAPASDLQLSDDAVSRSHFALRLLPDGYLLTDLESSNGTFVEGRRVHSAYLQPGDTIEIGRTRIKFEGARESVELALSRAEAFGNYRGRSTAARRVIAMLEQLASEDVTVLLLGETGTGKDTVAEALHENSARKKGPFVVLDCGAIPVGLIESELFGHEKGAFTGATADHLGVFRQAHGGTVFLDEIGELPRELQPRLLRALERREVKPVGAARPVPIDVRVIAATNRDLRVDVNSGLFREDLFYRLNVVSLVLPPLRERPEDIPLLAAQFWNELQPEGGLPKEFLEPLLRHSWPGNVRELRNRVERAAYLDRRPEITGAEALTKESFHFAKQHVVDAFERRFLTELLQKTGGNISEAARRAELDRVHLRRLLRKYGLKG